MPGARYAVSLKADGNMDFRFGDAASVADARRIFCVRAGVDVASCVVMRVEHGERIVAVGRADAGAGMFEPESAVTAEALMTDEPDLALVLLTADCLPVAFSDPVRGTIALAHLGWRPLSHGLVGTVVSALYERYGSTPADMHVRIGPGIAAASYAFEMLTQASDPAWRPFMHVDDSGRRHADLRGFCTAQLLSVGVPAEHLAIDDTDTAAEVRCFSHYRAVRTGEQEGRFATVLARAADATIYGI